MRRLNRKGQSVLEYVIILTAIVVGFLLAAGHIRNQVNNSLGQAAQHMEDQVTGADGLDYAVQCILKR